MKEGVISKLFANHEPSERHLCSRLAHLRPAFSTRYTRFEPFAPSALAHPVNQKLPLSDVSSRGKQRSARLQFTLSTAQKAENIYNNLLNISSDELLSLLPAKDLPAFRVLLDQFRSNSQEYTLLLRNRQNSVSPFFCRVETVLALNTGGPDL